MRTNIYEELAFNDARSACRGICMYNIGRVRGMRTHAKKYIRRTLLQGARSLFLSLAIKRYAKGERERERARFEGKLLAVARKGDRRWGGGGGGGGERERKRDAP